MASDPGTRRADGGLTRKGAQTRQKIVAAAAGLILEQGVAGTTLEEVRAEAGVSSSQIYHYFADKEALVRAVVDYRAQTVVGETHEPALAAIEGIDGLRAWRDMIVSVQEDAGCQGGCPLGSLGSELAELDHVARHDVAAGFSRWEAAIRACLQGMRDRGQLIPAADPDQLATAMLAALEGGLLLAQIQRNTRPLAAALDVMISLTESLAPPRQQPAILPAKAAGDQIPARSRHVSRYPALLVFGLACCIIAGSATLTGTAPMAEPMIQVTRTLVLAQVGRAPGRDRGPGPRARRDRPGHPHRARGRRVRASRPSDASGPEPAALDYDFRRDGSVDAALRRPGDPLRDSKARATCTCCSPGPARP